MGSLQPNQCCHSEGPSRLGGAPSCGSFGRGTLLLVAALVVLSATFARAAETFPLSYSGRLTQNSGAPVEGPVDLEVKFFSAESEGTQLGDAYPFTAVTLQQGIFTLSLQLTPKDVKTILGTGSEPVYIEVNAAGRVYPRQRFSVVPFALRVPVDNSSLVYDAVSGKLSVNGAGTATPGQILTSDGGGKVRWDNLSYANLSAKTASGGQPGEDQIITYKAGKWVAGNLGDIPTSFGTVTAVTATPPLTVTNQNSAPVISIAQASGSISGYLSSSDWTVFSAKQEAGSYLTDLTGDIVASGPGSGSASLAAVALPGTATKVTFDAKGRVLSGSSLSAADISGALGYAPLSSVNIVTGAGLSGGLITNAGTITLASTGVTPGTYVRANVVVDAQGRLLSAASAPQISDADIAAGAGIAQSKILGLQSDLGSKEPALPSGGGLTQFLAGSKTWQSLSTAVVSEDAANLYYTDARSRAALSATSPLTYFAGTGVLSLNRADGVSNGYLSSTDWTTFNAKQNALGFTPANRAGDTMSGALDMNGNDVKNAGNIQIAAAKTLGLGVYAADPMGLAASDKGKTWYNATDNQMKYWDGTTVQVVGAVGAALASLNGQTGATQSFAVPGSAGTAPTWSSSGNVHTLSIPLSSAAGVTAGLLSNGDYSVFNAKQPAGSYVTNLSGDITSSGFSSGTVATTLQSVALPGTATKLTYDVKGRVTSGTSLTAADLPPLSGAMITSGTVSLAYGGTGTNLTTTGGAGQYLKQVTAGGAVTVGTLPSADITNALGYTPANKAGDTMSGSLNMGGNDISNSGNIQIAAAKTLGLGVYAADPTGLAAGDKGKTWYNATDNQMKYWDGTAVQVVGAVGAALASLNGQTGATQSFAVPGSSGTAPAWSSAGNVHTLSIPLSSAAGVTAGLLSNNDYSAFNAKQPAGSYVTNLSGDITSSGFSSGTVATTLQSVALPGTATKLTYDVKGRVTSGTSLTAADLPPLSGAMITSGTVGLAYGGTGTNLTTTGGAGQYLKQVTAGGAVTVGTLPSADITNALGYTPANKAGDTMSGALNMGGNDISNSGNIQIAAAKTLGLGVYTADPTGLSAGDKGKTWFNSAANQMKYWDGTTVQVVGAVGAALASLNGQTGASQSFAVPGSTGTAPAWSSAGNVHTINIPLSSAAGVTAGLLSNGDYSVFHAKQPAGSYLTAVTGDITTSGFASGTVTATLPIVATAGTATKVTFDAKGRVTSGASLAAADLPAHSASLITSGTLGVANGGTGAATLSANGVLLGNGSGPLLSVAPGNSGNVLTSNGSTWTSATPPTANWAAPGAIGVTTPNSGAFTTLATTGNVGVGVAAPTTRLHIASDTNWEVAATVQNPNAGSDALAAIRLKNDGANSFIAFLNSSARSVDGGANTATVRNDAGALKLQAAGGFNSSAGITVAANSGNVGIGTTAPSARFEVSGGAIRPSVGNSPSSGIYFPTDPGSGAGDEAFIRYYSTTGETTKLMIGTNNDADDSIGFSQMGAERMTIYNGNVGVGTTNPSAALDINSTTTGFLPPRLTTTQRNAIASPSVGLTVYNTTSNLMEMYNGVGWVLVGQNMPEGAIMAFASASCPAGWTEYSEAYGRFLRGIDKSGTSIDLSGQRAPGNIQDQDWKGFSMHNTGQGTYSYSHGPVDMGKSTSSYTGNLFIGYWQAPAAALGTKWNTNDEVRPKNVAVLYCRYSGGSGVSVPAGANQVIQGNSSVTVTDSGSNGAVALATEGADRLNIDANGNVGINTTSPGIALDVNGYMARKIWRVHGYNQGDGGDNNYVTGRSLVMTKYKSGTSLRVSYTDNMRTYSADGGCRWEVRIDGASCSQAPLAADVYSHGWSNLHHNRTFVGYCDTVAAGSHTLAVYVSSSPGYSGIDCSTGWQQAWTLEAEEVN